jgi:DNA-binding CsgD family transcriptional regulator
VTQAELVGRERELEIVRRFCAAVLTAPAALAIQGEAGIGKTSIWRFAVEFCEQQGHRVLISRPVEAEMPLLFSDITDLLEGVLEETRNALPESQARALDVALARTEPRADAPIGLAVSRGTLEALRAASAFAPVVVAIDDAQWLDPASASLLAFTLRRLKRERISWLVTQRAGAHDPLALDEVSVWSEFHRLDLGPLSIGAISQLVRTRIAGRVPRTALARVHRESGGNPMFALELARALIAVDSASAAAPLPIPQSLREFIRSRISSLPPDLLPLLQMVTTLGRPTTVSLLQALEDPIRGDARLAAAMDAGVLAVEAGGVVRFTHPLLAGAVYADASPERRRQLHARAAEVTTDLEERARHLAVASAGPNEEVAAHLDDAARRAWSRGAPEVAATLAEEAQRLTPPERLSDLGQRGLVAAEYLTETADSGRAREVLDALIQEDVGGPVRARALFLRAIVEFELGPTFELLERALREAGEGGVPERIRALSKLGWDTAVYGGKLAEGATLLREALVLAEQLNDPAPLAGTLTGLAHVEALQGHRSTRLLKRAIPLADRVSLSLSPLAPRPRLWLGVQRTWAADLAGARALLCYEHDTACCHGNEAQRAHALWYLAEVDWRAGAWELARREVEEAYEIYLAGDERYGQAALLPLRALIAAQQGRLEAARADCLEGLRLSERYGVSPLTLRNRWVMGFLELSLGDYDRAWEALEDLPDELMRMGVREPAAFPLLPDAIEVLIALDELDTADQLVSRLEQQARDLHHAWASPAAQRCRGLLSLARGNTDASLVLLTSAVAGFERISYQFDLGRSLLALGNAHRRAGQRRLAEEVLKTARVRFDKLGAPLWSAKVETELARARGRRSPAGKLTGAESRVALLVAEGHTNKEVAAQLFTTVSTVESHLTSIYRKLDLRSRSGLVRRVADGLLDVPPSAAEH